MGLPRSRSDHIYPYPYAIAVTRNVAQNCSLEAAGKAFHSGTTPPGCACSLAQRFETDVVKPHVTSSVETSDLIDARAQGEYLRGL